MKQNDPLKNVDFNEAKTVSQVPKLGPNLNDEMSFEHLNVVDKFWNKSKNT